MRRPDAREFSDLQVMKLLAQSRDHSDRELALVAASVLEAFLAEVFQLTLGQIAEQELQASLEDQGGALYSFAHKIQIGVCIGLLDSAQHHDLSLVRKIRNKFAHTLMPLSFEDEPVRGLCSGFRSLEAMTKSFTDMSEEERTRRTVPEDKRMREDDPNVVALKLDTTNYNHPRERYIGNVYTIALALAMKASTYRLALAKLKS